MFVFWVAVCGFAFGISPHVLSEQNTGVLIVANEDDTQECSADVDDSAETVEVFLPTHEWQTVKPGQGIPRGLHVRMNLETGLKEAKLMPSEDTHQAGPHERQTFSKKTVKELKEALRLLQDDDGNIPNDGAQNKFRSIEEIKEEFESLNIKMTTEEQIIEELLAKFSEEDGSTKQQTDIFLELEYYVHKYDNAVEFARLGGIQKAILALNSSDEALRAASAFLLGSAVQSHPQIKVLALDNGAMQSLIRHLAVDASRSVQIKCLYAISCLIRQFPYAQKTFLELGGLSILGEFFRKSDADAEKLQIKSVALLYDTIMEHQFTSRHASSVGVATDGKLLQYAQVNIKEAVKQFELCPYIPRLLSSPDHDTREKVVRLMSVLVDICWQSFFEWDDQIELLQKQYHRLALEETVSNKDVDDETYFSEITDVIDNLLKSLRQHATRHSEL